jgi:GAF domain-containing protein
MTEKFTLKRYQQLVEAQSQALLDIVGAAAFGQLPATVKVPEGIEILSDLAVGLNFLIDDLRALTAERDQIRAEVSQEKASDQRQIDRLAVLNELSQQLGTARHEADLFQIAAVQLPRLFKVERASVTLVDETGVMLNVFALSGEAGLIPLGSSLPVVQSAAGVAFQTGKIHLVADTAAADPSWVDVQRLVEQQIQSIMNAPLIIDEAVIGTLNLASEQLNGFTPFDQQLLVQLTMLLSLTLQNKRFLAQTAQRLRNEQRLQEVTARVRAGVDIDTVLRTAVREVGQALNRPAFIYLSHQLSHAQQNSHSNGSPNHAEKRENHS